MANLTSIIQQNADLARNSGGRVALDSAYSTVAIEWDGGECFMQGDEAAQFIDAVIALWEAAGDATIDDCELCEAWPYIETISD